jgi:hypothetical protein
MIGTRGLPDFFGTSGVEEAMESSDFSLAAMLFIF